jgi:hypothetical protein
MSFEGWLGLLLQLHHGFDGLFDGRNPINPMTIIKVDGVHAESLEALFACSLDVLGISPKGVPSIRLALEGKLGGQENVIALARSLNPFTDDILAVTVNVGHVPKTQSGGMCMVQKGYFFVEGTSWSVEPAEAPETETNGRDLGAISAQGSQGKRHFEV